MKYRKKPVVIEAEQWDGTVESFNKIDLLNIDGNDFILRKENGTLLIPTLEGDMIASIGDYIIRGVSGEVYPCKPDIFDMTYEPA